MRLLQENHTIAHLVHKTDFYSIYQDKENYYVQADNILTSLPVHSLDEAIEFVIMKYEEIKKAYKDESM